MKKVRKQDHARERHGETCMCKKCRSRIEAMFYRKGVKTRFRDIKANIMVAREDDD